MNLKNVKTTKIDGEKCRYIPLTGKEDFYKEYKNEILPMLETIKKLGDKAFETRDTEKLQKSFSLFKKVQSRRKDFWQKIQEPLIKAKIYDHDKEFLELDIDNNRLIIKQDNDKGKNKGNPTAEQMELIEKLDNTLDKLLEKLDNHKHDQTDHSKHDHIRFAGKRRLADDEEPTGDRPRKIHKIELDADIMEELSYSEMVAYILGKNDSIPKEIAEEVAGEVYEKIHNHKPSKSKFSYDDEEGFITK